jgi:hypothetical protein
MSVYFMAIWSIYFTAIWYILWRFGIFCGHLVHFVAIWYILWPFGIFCGHFWYTFSYFGMLLQGKSGNPDAVKCPNSLKSAPVFWEFERLANFSANE